MNGSSRWERSWSGSRPAGRVRIARAVAAALALACLSRAGACGAPVAACPRADVWVASTRRLPGICRMPDRAALAVERLSCGDHGRWERATTAEMLTGDAPLVVFIHGNRYATVEAKSQGLRVARLVSAACPGVGPVRTIIFSWPSEQQGHLVRDVRAKYARAHADGHYLAWLLEQVPPHRDLAVVGYSYGALVGLEALRDLSNARHDGAPTWAERPGRTNLVFITPAVRCDALAPCGPYRETLAGVDRLTLVVNSDDLALRFFPHVDTRVRAEALGVTGMPRRWVPPHVEYAAVDGADLVGRQHNLPLYLDSLPLVRRISAGAVDGLGPTTVD